MIIISYFKLRFNSKADQTFIQIFTTKIMTVNLSKQVEKPFIKCSFHYLRTA